MKLHWILLLSLFSSLSPAMAQDQNPEELFEDALFFYYREDYEESAYLFRQLSRMEPENNNVQYLLGMSYLNIPGLEKEAIPCFLKATEKINLKYKADRYTEKKAPYHTWYYLGDAYAVTNQLDLALDAYETFKSLKNFENKYNAGVTDERIAAVERAKIIQDARLDLKTFCLEEPVNTPESDYCGVISADENMLVWVSSQRFYEAVLMSVKKEGKWTDPVNITPQILSDGDLFPTGLSADGTELLLVKRGKSDSDIYHSRYNGNLWSAAVPLKGEINSNQEEDHASFAPDGKRIYFSSARRGSVGGLDIYFSDLTPDGIWGQPVNMGELINTRHDETSPYVAPDGKTLFFSSKGHFNMGGYDIFTSVKMLDGSWSKPANIGSPINTTEDNLYFVPLGDGKTWLYTRFTEECTGKEDLWFVEIIPYEESHLESLTRLSENNFLIKLTDDSGETINLEYDAENDRITVKSSSGTRYRVVQTRKE
ncbi:MAG: PD40 domain-containing protein [Bacteroidales bacterium]|nr:PD40 domain-containing protein [Bacteroidales bacterium]MBN2697349.1 PD40 domain-containing protein [Bacteroidales bacterium]